MVNNNYCICICNATQRKPELYLLSNFKFFIYRNFFRAVNFLSAFIRFCIFTEVKTTYKLIYSINILFFIKSLLKQSVALGFYNYILNFGENQNANK